MNGRRLVITDEVSVEVVKRVDQRWHPAGLAALTLRWRSVGLATGVERRPGLSDGLLGFVRLGLVAIRLAG